jgi:hypothetical protein
LLTGDLVVKVLGETASSLEILANDRIAREIAEDLKLSPEKAKDLASSVVSLKLSAIKSAVRQFPHPSPNRMKPKVPIGKVCSPAGGKGKGFRFSADLVTDRLRG